MVRSKTTAATFYELSLGGLVHPIIPNSKERESITSHHITSHKSQREL